MSVRSYAVTVPADSRYLKVIRAFFQSVLRDSGDETGMLILALDEACSNIVKHRRVLQDHAIHVRAEVGADSVRFRIGDFCAREDIPTIKPRDLADVRPGGLGTHFIDQIMDEVRFEPEPGPEDRVALVMEKRLSNGEVSDGGEV